MTVLDAPTRAPAVPWRHIGVFVLLAFGSTWLWWALLGGRLPSAVLEGGSMVCVALATFATLRWSVRPASIPAATALVRPHRPRWLLLGFLLIPVVNLAGLGLGWLTGDYRVDLADFSGLRAAVAPDTVGGTGVPWALIGSMLGTSALLFTLTLPLMWCEEWGWRGFLLPRLLPLGLWPALLFSGVIWALWHLPIYLGAGGRDLAGLPPFLVTAVLLGVLFGWLRLASGSVWPCVLAHGANNAVATVLTALFIDADQLRTPNLAAQVGVSSWTGWVALAVASALAFALRPVRARS
ncbi:CPBP family intramembrane glutamic endopeptidase [Crossiella sp. CA198]|uniref:CPBP family intramembrane glutamic endopeptidase n=1 Tax=Crossiella sp. CA198 TaxID=3455607 RepID=UPI003F8D28E3